MAVYFRKSDNTGFNYYYEGSVSAGETKIIRFPVVNSNRRGVNDIGWQIDGDATLYATLMANPRELKEGGGAIWQEIRPNEGINKTTAAIKIVAGAGTSKVYIRIILN